MAFINLFNPHVSIVADDDHNHYFSIVMIVPENSSVKYRTFNCSEPPSRSTTPHESKYEIEFGFEVEDGPWFDIDGLSRVPIRLGTIDLDLLQFYRPIDHDDFDLKRSEFSTRVDDSPYDQLSDEIKSVIGGIKNHDDTVHLPGGS